MKAAKKYFLLASLFFVSILVFSTMLVGSVKAAHQFNCAMFDYSDDFCSVGLFSSSFCSSFDQTSACIDDPDNGSFETFCFPNSANCGHFPTTTPTLTPTSTPQVCTCGPWSFFGICDDGACDVDERPQRRTCNPAGCNLESQCAFDPTCLVPTPTRTPTPTPTITPTPPESCDLCGTCPSRLGPTWQRYCSFGFTERCDPSGCSAPTSTPTITPAPTLPPGVTPTITPTPTNAPTPGPTSTPTTPPPTPTPSAFTVTITVSNFAPAINEQVTVTAGVSGIFNPPVEFDLNCDSNASTEVFPDTNDNPFLFPIKCSYSTSGEWKITVNAVDSSTPTNKIATTNKTVNVLKRYACQTVSLANSTNCQGSASSIRYCSDTNDQKGCTVQGSGSFYTNCSDCNDLSGCASSTRECSLLPTPTPTPPLTLQCLGYGPQDRCIGIKTAIGDIAIDPGKFVSRIMSLLLGISGAIAVILIILAGYSIMTSRDNPEKLQEARQRILGAIAGLIFIALALVILEIIGVDVLKIPGFER